MKVLGQNILISPKVGGIKKTSYGFELGEKHREKERYQQGTILHIGEDVKGVNVGDEVIFDKMAGHFIDLEDVEDTVRVITHFDIKLILDEKKG